MKTSFSPWLACAVMLGVCGWHAPLARADDPLASLQTLESAVRTAAAEQREVAKKEADNHGLPARFYDGQGIQALRSVAQLRFLLDTGEPTQIDEAVREVAAAYPTDAVLAACGRFQEDLRQQREANRQATAKQIQTLLDKTTQAIRSAQKPSDLDATCHRLSGRPVLARAVWRRATARIIGSRRRATCCVWRPSTLASTADSRSLSCSGASATRFSSCGSRSRARLWSPVPSRPNAAAGTWAGEAGQDGDES